VRRGFQLLHLGGVDFCGSVDGTGADQAFYDFVMATSWHKMGQKHQENEGEHFLEMMGKYDEKRWEIKLSNYSKAM
jgi:hypothetical protein